MKNLILLSLAAVLIVTFAACKKSDSGSPTSPGTTENYFPENEGTNYKYSYVRIDSTGQHTGAQNCTTYRGSTTVCRY